MGSRLNDATSNWSSIPDARLFTQDQLAELKECFLLFDTTGSGYIESRDLGRALRALGQNPSEHDVSRMLEETNLDASGRLNANEYLRVIGHFGLKKETEMQEELNEAFRVFDRNDAGSISAEELRMALKAYGEGLGDKDVEQIMKLAAVKDDGTINFLEFTQKLTAK